jgi:hypothetical protein
MDWGRNAVFAVKVATVAVSVPLLTSRNMCHTPIRDLCDTAVASREAATPEATVLLACARFAGCRHVIRRVSL